jgi:hypothetical protein
VFTDIVSILALNIYYIQYQTSDNPAQLEVGFFFDPFMNRLR